MDESTEVAMPIEEHNAHAYEKKRAWHREQAQLPLKEKHRILLEMQKQDLPLIARRRPLKWYEKPWDIEPYSPRKLYCRSPHRFSSTA